MVLVAKLFSENHDKIYENHKPTYTESYILLFLGFQNAS